MTRDRDGGLRGFPWARVLFAIALAGALSLLARACTVGPDAVAWWMIALDALLVLGAVGAGVFVQGAGLFARPLLGVDPERARDRVALTFDDGPHPVHTRAVLDLLDAAGQRATFFVIGARADGQEPLLAEMVRRGHQLANHSWAHAHSTPFLPPAALAAELERAQALLGRAATSGSGASRWFRAPVGILSPRVVEAAKRARLQLVGWTATARDGIGSATVEKATRRLQRALKPGAILVLHDAAERGDRAPIAPEVLRRLLPELRARGLRSVTLDELTAKENA